MSAIPELRYEARCADLEEFVVAYQGFVEEGTLVLPTHPHLKIGGECHFTIVLRTGGRVVLGGRCSGLEVLSDGQGFRRGSKAVRVRVLEIDPAFRAVHDRLVTRGRFDSVADPRLGRLQNLLRAAALPPAAPAATFDEPTNPEEVPAPRPGSPAAPTRQTPLPLGPPLPRPRPAPLPLTVRKAAAAPRTPPVPHPLLPIVEIEGPAPAPAVAAPVPADAPPAPASVPAPPARALALVGLRSSSARLALWWLSRNMDPLRGGLTAALRRGVPIARAGWAAARRGLGRHRKVVIAGLLGFAVGLAVRGGPHPRPAAASPAPLPTAPARERRAILDSRAPVGTLTPVEIGDATADLPAPGASVTTTSATVTPSPPTLRHRRRTARRRHFPL
jgi:hypothetical protein